MAILVRYHSVIIPIKNIEKCKNLGGFKGILKKQKQFIGKRVFYDKYLYKDGAMSPRDTLEIIHFWEEQGLVPKIKKNGQEYWNDLCALDELEGLHLPCEWLECDKDENGNFYVWLKGQSKGKIISILNFSNHFPDFLNNLIRRFI